MHNETVQATLRNTYILPEPALDYKVTGEDIAAGLTSAHVRALWYADRGIAVIPARKDDSKRPAIPWKEYQHRRPTSAELARWFLDEGYEELLIMTGDVSAVAAIDCDTPEAFALVRELYPSAWSDQSARGGHLLYRTNGTPISNGAHVEIAPGLHVDIRGDGGVIRPPHAQGRRILGDWTVPKSELREFPTSAFAGRQRSASRSRVKLDIDPKPSTEPPSWFLEKLQERAFHIVQSIWIGVHRPAQDTSRSGQDFHLTRSLLDRGLTPEQIAEVLPHFRFGRGQRATRRYLETTIANAQTQMHSWSPHLPTPADFLEPARVSQLVQKKLEAIRANWDTMVYSDPYWLHLPKLEDHRDRLTIPGRCSKCEGCQNHLKYARLDRCSKALCYHGGKATVTTVEPGARAQGVAPARHPRLLPEPEGRDPTPKDSGDVDVSRDRAECDLGWADRSLQSAILRRGPPARAQTCAALRPRLLVGHAGRG